MATRSARLSPELRQAVDRARASLEASGQLHPAPGPYRSSLGAPERAVVAQMLQDGTYRRLADAVASADPDLADR